MRNRPKQQRSALLACRDCQEPCALFHASRKEHTNISPFSLEQKLSLTEWKQQKKKIIQSLEKIVDEIRECIEKVEDSFELYIGQAMYEFDRKLSKKDENNFVDVLGKVWDENYDDITCDQLDKVLHLMNNSPLTNKLNQKFSFVERKISSQILDIVHASFPEQMKRKVQEILDDEIIKIKPHIQQYINKIKSVSQIKLPQKFQQKIPQNNHRQQQSRRPKRDNYDSESQQSNSSNLNAGFVEINRIKELRGGFNTIVRVLHIIEEEMKVTINGKISTQFLAGDETGVGIFVFASSSKIKQGNVLKLTNCRVYSFHGDKQVQFSKNSQIESIFDQINKIGNYYLSNHAKRLYEDNREQIRKLMSQKEDPFMKKKQPSKTQTSTSRQNDRKPASRIAESTRELQRGKVKIEEIGPKDQGMTIYGQVLTIYKKQGSRTWFALGDDTGIVEVSVSDHLTSKIKQGIYVKLSCFDSTLDQGRYILLQPSKQGNIQPTSCTCRTINTNNKISTKKINLNESTTSKNNSRVYDHSSDDDRSYF